MIIYLIPFDHRCHAALSQGQGSQGKRIYRRPHARVVGTLFCPGSSQFQLLIMIEMNG